MAILTLLLGTGIRVSECVGLDIGDVDFRNNGIRILRKGGYEAVMNLRPLGYYPSSLPGQVLPQLHLSGCIAASVVCCAIDQRVS